MVCFDLGFLLGGPNLVSVIFRVFIVIPLSVWLHVSRFVSGLMLSRLRLGQGMGASQGSMIRCKVWLRGLVAEWLCQRGVGRWRVRRLARVRLVGRGAGGARDRLRLGRLGFTV